MSPRPRFEPLTTMPDGVVAQRLNLPRLVRAQKTPGKHAADSGEPLLLATFPPWAHLAPGRLAQPPAAPATPCDRARLTPLRNDAAVRAMTHRAGTVRPVAPHRGTGQRFDPAYTPTAMLFDADIVDGQFTPATVAPGATSNAAIAFPAHSVVMSFRKIDPGACW